MIKIKVSNLFLKVNYAWARENTKFQIYHNSASILCGKTILMWWPTSEGNLTDCDLGDGNFK